jgi:hypothetical protein
LSSRDFNIGIDIGKHGAIVVLPKKPFTNSILPIKMPLIGDQLDYHEVYRLLKSYENTDCHVIFEKLGVIFGTGKSTAFSMGHQSGAIEMACVALNLPYTKVPAKQWQKEMFQGVEEILKKGKSSRDTKAMALIAAKRLFPDFKLTFGRATVPHDGAVDALLMAEYCKRKI